MNPMNYTFLPAPGLVHVHFEMPLPHVQTLYDTHFTGRDLYVNEQQEWLDLYCRIEEWEAYLVSGARGAAMIPDMDVAAFLLLELHAFRQWCAALRQTAFFKPVGGIQA